MLSMGQMDPNKLPKSFEMISFWSSWTISLMVTASNGFLQLFSLDKNYFSYAMVVEQLNTEGWQFFGLSGKYDDFENHQDSYKSFSKAIESIKRKQVEQEFSNGKGENKKKKFDFHGEMKKFSENQQVQQQQQQQPLQQMFQQPLQQIIQQPLEQIIQQPVEQIQKKIQKSSDNVEDPEKKLNNTIQDLLTESIIQDTKIITKENDSKENESKK